MKRSPRALGLLAAVVIGVAGWISGSVSAHEPGTTAIDLDASSDEVVAQIDLPVDKLEAALDTDLETDRLALSADRDLIVGYITDHLDIGSIGDVGGQGSEGWPETAGALTAITIDGVRHLRLLVDLDPGATMPDAFAIEYDGILADDDSHEIYITVSGDADAAGLVGVIDADTASVTVGGHDDGRGWSALVPMIGRGFSHVLDGADHLLFLFALLLPAPLVVGARRWDSTNDGHRALRRVVHVATAFTAGHSLTLAASALGWISLPSRPVEILVAISVAIAAVHALRPIVARGEVLIAGVFGLVHGLAFSGLLDELGLGTTTSLVSLLGFNLGIEAAQLLVIAVSFPSLWLLSRTRAYNAVRNVGAGIALVAATAWIIDRIGIADTPFAEIERFAVDNLPAIGGMLATGAVGIWSITSSSPKASTSGHSVANR